MNAAYKYNKIDAFTAGNSLGNPAACFFLGLEQQLSEQEMLAIAKQHKGFVSEVIFCENSDAGIRLTYYSSECEVDFCGHGTIACMYCLIKNTPVLLAKKEILIHTRKKGTLIVYNRIPEQDAVWQIFAEKTFCSGFFCVFAGWRGALHQACALTRPASASESSCRSWIPERRARI